MPWELKSDRPIYTQLIEQIELMIFSGVYPLGSKLPSVRDMAQEAAVNPNTMQRALVKLEEDGLIITHRTSGRSITEDARMVEMAKTKLAQEQISEFLAKMHLMGFEQRSILTIIDNMVKEMKK
ncbi:GntR family transcriptional regulator [Desulfosporosinus sp. BICA1-9]|uniref:GntR family transcriptional regulator n=1 Tax=Desulfosporosinus sp. BICA1-9 TaxID=1531958 RepID=UPI00054B3245|nr:GntR family transcriptional regulator [Desulfosporosinus sp. BICA1-9]KJS46689.1 MAG: GntR family transcriptional regulator [Peptococcaceae bacterium BRH_c23]KJS77809.1 MAG: GntR family transcriptional regulator [Desulfosporosinus sp. BICA1-9]HBW34774.1 GntR family transcriptional regulator [Desulfosporosinus sp.]